MFATTYTISLSKLTGAIIARTANIHSKSSAIRHFFISNTMRKILLALLLANLSVVATAQTYGNEWIDFSKTYYKFSVGANGIYRIGQPVLAAAGLGSTPAQNFKLFRNGQEVRLYTSIATGTLSASDYLEFYGLMNDGKAELTMYKTDDLQMCDKWSLLGDTASYFLTTNATANLRYTATANNLGGALPAAELYCTYTLGKYYKDRMNEGYGIDFGELVHSSSFDRGEGWTSNEIFGAATLSDANNSLQVYTAGPAATITTVAAGNRNNNRNINIKLNGTTIAGGAVSGFDIQRTNTTGIALSNFTGDAATIAFESTGAATDRVVASCYEITYPRQFNFNNTSQVSFDLPGGGADKYLVINGFAYGAVAPILYDLTNNLRMVGNIANGNLRYLLPASAATRKIVILNAEPASIKNVSSFTTRAFTNFAQAGNQGNYYIISHPLLYNDGLGADHVEQYRLYRSSAAGGSYNAKTVNIEQLMDQFGYGVRQNPLAIRNFSSYAIANFPTIPKYFFIIGKGLSYDELKFNETDPNYTKLALVPTFGFPASDNLLTASRTGVAARIPIGRISAIAGTEVKYYLDKVKAFELAQFTSGQSISGKGWMKNVAQITGGIDDQALYGLITAYMQGYEQAISDTSYGGRVYNFSKNAGIFTAIGTGKTIDTLFKDGLSLLTYFGHSSPNTLEFNLDNPQNYNNTGKYPLIIVNGCNTGNLFQFDTLRPISKGTLSEKYVFSENKGSIGFIASTHFGLPQQLNYVTLNFYRNLSNYNYGKGIGDVMKATMETVSTIYSNDFLAKAHCEEITYHGDPAVKLNTHTLPDYTIQDSLISFNPGIISVADDNVLITAKIINIGKAIRDSITVRFQHKLPDNSIVTVAERRIKATLYEDTLQVSLPLNPLAEKGLNQVIVTIDPNNLVPELSEINNTVTKSFTVIEDEIRPVYPYNYLIVGSSAGLALYGSTANPTISARLYTMEMDTTRNFNSPIKVVRTVNSIGGLIKFVPGGTLIDSTVYYWRITSGPVSGASRWLNSSFMYINGSAAGFAQGNYYQFTDDEFDKININAGTRRFGFDEVQRKLLVRAGIYPYYSWDRNNINVNSDQIEYWGCIFNNLQFYVLDSLSQKPWLNNNVGGNGGYNSWPVCGPPRKFFEFPFGDPVYRKRAMDFIDSIPAGQYVAIRPLMASSNTIFIDQWKADTATLGSGKSLYHKFKNLGFTMIDSFTTNKQFLFVFKKTATGVTDIRQRFGATVETQVSDTFQLAGKETAGTLTTPWLGPAKAWKRFKWNKRTNEDSVGVRQFDIIGKDYWGYEVSLATINTDRDTIIDFIDAATYPYLRLKMTNVDTRFAKATQLKYWMLTADLMPEGAVAPNVNFQFKDTLTPADTLKFKVAFKNMSNVPFDSLMMRIKVKDNYGNEQIFNPIGSSATFRVAPLAGNDSILISCNIPAADFGGKNQFVLDVNPDGDQPEQFHFNNLLYRNFWVLTVPCAGTNIFFGSGYLGSYNYQWQVNTGSGYTNVANNAVYSNVTGDSIKLTAPPSSWSGYKYRCLVTTGNDTYYSNEYTLRFGSRWTGAVSTAWNNPGNWSCGQIPDQYTDVTIPAGVPNYPNVTIITATCRSLTINTGASVTVQGGSVITVTGK